MAGSGRAPGRFQSGCDEADGELAAVQRPQGWQAEMAGHLRIFVQGAPCQMSGLPGNPCRCNLPILESHSNGISSRTKCKTHSPDLMQHAGLSYMSLNA